MTRILVIKRVEAAGKTFEFNKELVVSSSPFNAVIQFYRSLPHSKGKHGKEDSSYNGAFGFDKFDSSVMGKGLISTYETINTVAQKKENIEDNNKYLCSYMTLWHPKSVGNAENKKSKATIYVKAEEGDWEKQDNDVNTKSIELRVSCPDCITIDGASSIRISMTINNDAQPITIECTKFFTQPVEITAHADDHLFGKLIILSNQYTYKTTLQPVLLKFTTAESTTVKEEEHSLFVKSLGRRFNEQSFNQAYIYGDLAPKTIVVEFDKSKFSNYLTYEGDMDYDVAEKYNDLVERRFAAIVNKELTSNKAETELKEKIKVFLDEFDKRFNFTGSGTKYTQKKLEDKIVTTAFNHPKVQKAYGEYLRAKEAYEKAGSASEMNKEGKLYVFMTNDIKVAKKGTGDVLGYSNVGSGISHLFGRMISSFDGIPDAIHELGHALGLRHTFEPDLGEYELRNSNIRYEEDIEDEIDKLKDENIRYDERLKNFNKNATEETNKIHDLQNIEFSHYKALQRNIGYKESLAAERFSDFNHGIIHKITTLLAIEAAGSTSEARLNNMGSKDYQLLITNNESKIESAKNEKKNAPELEKLKNYNSQSESDENYMDYNENTSGDKNSNMNRVLFAKNQWDTIIETGISKKYLKK